MPHRCGGRLMSGRASGGARAEAEELRSRPSARVQLDFRKKQTKRGQTRARAPARTKPFERDPPATCSLAAVSPDERAIAGMRHQLSPSPAHGARLKRGQRIRVRNPAPTTPLCLAAIWNEVGCRLIPCTSAWH